MLAQRGVFNVLVSPREGVGDEFPPGFLPLLRLCCPLVGKVNFVSVLRTEIVSSAFCRVAIKWGTRGNGFVALLEIPSKICIFNVAG